MFFAAGVGAYGAAMFHLFTHAFFKALLFLGSGAVIIGMHHEQDMKKMGGLRQILPFTHILMLIGTVAITGVGLPFAAIIKSLGFPIGTAGFASKDMIIESAYAAGEAGAPFANYAFVMGIIAAVLTSFYSWRLIYLTFGGKSRAPEHVRKHPHAVPDTMMIPLIPLAVGALFAGMVFYGSFVGGGAEKFWNGALYSAASSHDDVHGEKVEHGAGHNDAAEHASDQHHTDEKEHAKESHIPSTKTTEAHAGEDGHGDNHHEFPAWVVMAPFVAMLVGFLTASFHYLRGDPLRPGLLREGGMIYAFLKNKWYFDEIYDFLIVKPALALGRFLWLDGDGKTIDGVGPDGIASAVSAGAKRIVRMQTGLIYHYAFFMLIGIALFISYILVRAGGGQ